MLDIIIVEIAVYYYGTTTLKNLDDLYFCICILPSSLFMRLSPLTHMVYVVQEQTENHEHADQAITLSGKADISFPIKYMYMDFYH